jgi:hypothetical protein
MVASCTALFASRETKVILELVSVRSEKCVAEGLHLFGAQPGGRTSADYSEFRIAVP